MTLSTRIGVMDAGRIVQVGEPPEVYEHPATRLVADFVGSVNLFEGRVVEDAPEHIRLHALEAGETPLYVGHGVSCVMNQRMWLAVRPEKLRLTRERPEGRANALSAEVEEVAYMGNLSVFQLRLPSGKRLRATRTNVARVDAEAISWDEQVWVSWDDTAGVVLAQ